MELEEEISLDLAIRVVNICQTLCDENRNNIVAEHLLKSCIALRVSLHYSEYSDNVDDMVKYLNSTLAELEYTTQWLDLMYETGVISCEVFDSLHGELENLDKLLKKRVTKDGY